MLSRSLVLAILLTGGAGLAQDDGPDFDASLPDASVGIGGADQNNQEMGDGTSNTVCASTRDCERGFACNKGKCTYAGYRVATCQGCSNGAMAAMLPLALLWRSRRRRWP
jgi:uncharacterized protein (TIGR03382 family)